MAHHWFDQPSWATRRRCSSVFACFIPVRVQAPNFHLHLPQRLHFTERPR